MTSHDNVAVYGAGHLGRQTLTHLRNHFPHLEVAGFVDDRIEAGEHVVHGLDCLGALDDVACSADFGPSGVGVVFAIGYADMRARRRALDRIEAAGYKLVSVIHPQAIVDPTATVEDGCTVLAGAIIDQGAHIEAGSYVDIGVRVGEDAVIGRSSYVSSGAALGGRVRVGADSFLGMDCTITTGVSVGRHCFIIAKSLVARDLQDDTKLVEIHKARELPNA